MLIAGEPSGDMLAAELVTALRKEFDSGANDETGEIRFFGAGGPRMAEAGVQLALDLTQHAIVGLLEVLKNYGKFRRLFWQLVTLATSRKPDLIICVDYSGFNRRFASAIREQVRSGKFGNWKPKIVQYVSPQVWASREGRAFKMAEVFDLLLTIFPFEKSWYAKRTPHFKVEFVGHPLVDRYPKPASGSSNTNAAKPLIVLLPGSRYGELKRHLPVMAEALRLIERQTAVEHIVVLPNERLLEFAQAFLKDYPELRLQVGGLAETLARAELAIASTGTVTLECAWFGVPTVAMYKTSWSTYQIGKRIIKVRFLAMPNLLADECILPELIQDEASPENIARESLELLGDKTRRNNVKSKLAAVAASLGEPGASQKAAAAIARLANLSPKS